MLTGKMSCFLSFLYELMNNITRSCVTTELYPMQSYNGNNEKI